MRVCKPHGEAGGSQKHLINHLASPETVLRMLCLLSTKGEQSYFPTLAWVRSFWGEDEIEFGYRLVWVDLCSYSGP